MSAHIGFLSALSLLFFSFCCCDVAELSKAQGRKLLAAITSGAVPLLVRFQWPHVTSGTVPLATQSSAAVPLGTQSSAAVPLGIHSFGTVPLGIQSFGTVPLDIQSFGTVPLGTRRENAHFALRQSGIHSLSK